MFADNWCIKSNERVYGPYSSRDLRKFANEGRFAAWSMVAPAGSREWREARLEPTFASIFGLAEPTANGPRPFGRQVGDYSEDPVGDETQSREPRRARAIGAETRKTQPTEQVGPANFIIVFDTVNAAASRVENALSSLGNAFRLAENVWTVNCALTAIGVRNAIAPFLRPHESLFVVDATNGRTSWQNYAPEAHAKITQSFVHTKR